MNWLEISPDWRIPLEEISFEYSRSSGPGGQNVNKVSSKATLRWNTLATQHLREDVRERLIAQWGTRLNLAGELMITSQQHRDQERNRGECLDRLVEILRSVERAPKKRRPTKPSRGSKRRRLEGKKRRSETKQQRRGPIGD